MFCSIVNTRLFKWTPKLKLQNDFCQLHYFMWKCTYLFTNIRASYVCIVLASHFISPHRHHHWDLQKVDVLSSCIILPHHSLISYCFISDGYWPLMQAEHKWNWKLKSLSQIHLLKSSHFSFMAFPCWWIPSGDPPSLLMNKTITHTEISCHPIVAMPLFTRIITV